MVDIGDLALINALYAEAAAIDQSFINFQRGGVIISMVISAWPPEGSEPPEGAPESMGNAMVDTSHITYPGGMTSMIVDQLQSRRATINTQLQGLGVTGLGPPPPATLPQPQR